MMQIVFLCVLMLCTFYFEVVTAVCQLLINGYVMWRYLTVEEYNITQHNLLVEGMMDVVTVVANIKLL